MNPYSLSNSTLRLIVKSGKYTGMNIKSIISSETEKNIHKWFNQLLATSFFSNPKLSTWGKAVSRDFSSVRMRIQHFKPKGECSCVFIEYPSKKFETIYFPKNLLQESVGTGIYKGVKVKEVIKNQRYLKNIESKARIKDPVLRKVKKHLII
jgi:hypothetical protein